VQWAAARLKLDRNFKQGPNKPQPKLDCRFSPQHFHLLSSPSYSRCFHGSPGVIRASARLGGGAARTTSEQRAAGSGPVRAVCSAPNLPVKLRTWTLTAFQDERQQPPPPLPRDFNELAAGRQPTYLPPAAPPPPQSLPLPAPILAAPRQRGKGERNYLLCAC